MKIAKAIDQILLEVRGLGLPMPVREYQFHLVRKWRFDLCWVDHQVALEYEGGEWGASRHRTSKGYADDCEKYSNAAILGWCVIRICRSHLDSGIWIDWIRRALEAKTPAG